MVESLFVYSFNRNTFSCFRHELMVPRLDRHTDYYNMSSPLVRGITMNYDTGCQIKVVIKHKHFLLYVFLALKDKFTFGNMLHVPPIFRNV